MLRLARTPKPQWSDQDRSAARGEASESDGLSLRIYPGEGEVLAGRLELMGDPARLRGRGYDATDERTWMAAPAFAALGLGALGACFEDCRARFWEFLAVAGVAA